MLYLDLNGQRLHLRPGTTLNMELVSPLLADGIEDSHSMPLELPTAGNEIPLGHVHQLPLGNRVLSLPGAKAGHDGTPLHEGTLTVLASDKDTVRTTLSAEAFVVLMGETKLRTALENERVDMNVESGSIAAHVVAKNALVAAMTPGADDTGWTHYFPLYFNPALYGSENPSWYPSANEWSASSTYAVDDLVIFYPADPVRKARRYQCIVATTAGQSPTTHASKWKEVAYGLVNVMDPITGDPKTNSSDGNYYAIVPWWRLRHIVLKVLEYFGLQAQGDAFLDSGPLGPKSMYTLGNNVPLDAEPRDNYFYAGQTDEVFYTPGTNPYLFPIPAQDESTGDFQDTGGLWDNTNMTFTPTGAGQYYARVKLDIEFPLPLTLRIFLVETDGTVINQVYATQASHSAIDSVIYFSFTVTTAMVGNPILFFAGGFGSIVVGWPSTDEHTHRNSSIMVWRAMGVGVNGYRSAIKAADHVPDWTAAEFLDRVADAYNLEVVPDMEQKVVRFNRRVGVLENVAGNLTHHDRLLGTPELDHSRKTTGIRFAWPIDKGEQPAMSDMNRLPDVWFESELDTPASTQQYVVVRSTRQIYVSVFKPGGFVWEARGYEIAGAQVGVESGGRTIQVEFIPVHMAEVGLDEDKFIVAKAEEAGSSSFFGGSASEGKAWLGIANGYSLGQEGTPYVTANSWGRCYDSTEDQPNSLALEGDLLASEEGVEVEPVNHFDAHHRPWWEMIVKAEAVTADLEVDHAFIRSKTWRRFLVMRNQTYLVQRMPVVYGSAGGNLVSKGAYLLRVRQPESPDNAPTTSFACAGPGYVPVFIGDGTGSLLFVASGGYFTVRSPDGSVDTFESNTQVDGLTSGAYCVWPSDAEGNKTGQFTVSSIGLGTIWFDLAGIEGMGPYEEIQILETVMATLTLPLVTGAPYIYIDASPMSIINIDPAQRFAGIYVTGANLLASTVDALIIAAYNSAVNGVTVTGVDLSGGTSAAPTAASAAALAALDETYGVPVTTN